MFDKTTFFQVLNDQVDFVPHLAIAGSYALALLHSSFEPNDLDLWVDLRHEEAKDMILAFAKALGVKEEDLSLSGSENEITSFTYGGFPIQIICWYNNKGRSWTRLLDSFDMECCQVALVPHTNTKFIGYSDTVLTFDNTDHVFKLPYRCNPHEGPDGVFGGIAGMTHEDKNQSSSPWVIPAMPPKLHGREKDGLYCLALALEGRTPRPRRCPSYCWTCPDVKPVKGWTIWGRASTFRAIFTLKTRAWRDLTSLTASGLSPKTDKVGPFGPPPRMTELDETRFQQRCQKYRDRGFKIEICDDLRETSYFTHYKRLKTMINT